jgi:Domain of unknown function (DUF1987).
MENLIIEKTKSTPGIDFDVTSGLLQIKGESFPENVVKFYAPIIDWIKNYINSEAKETTLEFEIIYFNSSTSKVFMTIFDFLDKEVGNGKSIKVKWLCDSENETAIECGEEFKEDIDLLPFEIEIF